MKTTILTITITLFSFQSLVFTNTTHAQISSEVIAAAMRTTYSLDNKNVFPRKNSHGRIIPAMITAVGSNISGTDRNLLFGNTNNSMIMIYGQQIGMAELNYGLFINNDVIMFCFSGTSSEIHKSFNGEPGNKLGFFESVGMGIPAIDIPAFQGVPVHQGWAVASENIYPAIKSLVETHGAYKSGPLTGQKKQIIVSGYSMGGAIAGYTSYLLAKDNLFPNVRPSKLITFGDNDTHRQHRTHRPPQRPQLLCGTDPQLYPQTFPAPQPNPYPQPSPAPQPMAQTLPTDLQGRWYEVSPHNTRYTYDLRTNDYDMYEIDPTTNRVMVGQDGLPIRLLGEPLAYSNGILTLSPGPDQDGPLMISVPPAKFPKGKTLTPMSGGASRYFTRRPVKISSTTTLANPVAPQVKGHNVKTVHFTTNNTASKFAQVAKGTWVEVNPEGVSQFQETGRDEWSVYLTRTDGVVKAQLDLYRKMIVVDGRNTHQIDKVQ